MNKQEVSSIRKSVEKLLGVKEMVSQHRKNKSLTINQKSFIDRILETGDLQSAAMQVYGKKSFLYPATAKKKGQALIKKPEIALNLLKVWDEVGLTLDAAAFHHLRIMMDPASKGSEVLKAVDMVYKGNRAPGFVEEPKGKKSSGAEKSPISIYIDQRQSRGLPIPADVKDAAKELGIKIVETKNEKK